MLFSVFSSAQSEIVDLELILAIDVSTSIDDVEATWQRNGYVIAFKNPQVISAISSGKSGQIALMVVEWAGENYQRTLVPWTRLRNQSDIINISVQLKKALLLRVPNTSIGALINFSRQQFNNNHFVGYRKVLDISGDGPSSSGDDVKLARDTAIREGIVINGLPILSIRPNPTVGLDEYYRRNVIGGYGSFLYEANMLEDFSEPLVKKLVREIQGKKEMLTSQYISD